MTTSDAAAAGALSVGSPAPPTTVGGAALELTGLFRDKGLRDPERWAAAAVAAVIGIPTADLRGAGGRTLSGSQAECLRGLADQASADAPVAYMIGRAPFRGRDFSVTRDTLIPKVDTELFLDIVFAEVAKNPLPPGAHVLELCCGSGCVAVTLAYEYADAARVLATDISPEALAVAARNIDEHGMNGRVLLGRGDLFAPVAEMLGGAKLDLLVSNPPYIPTEKIPEMGAAVAGHEPHLALDGGADGLDPHRRILDEGRRYLKPGARVLLEHEWYHGEAARALASAIPGYTDIRTFADANGKDRALYARYIG